MSALRVPGPDGRIVLRVIDDGAVGRISHSRLGIKGGSIFGVMVTGVSSKPRTEDHRMGRAHSVRYRPGVSATTLGTVRKNPDNGAVEASITEVHP